MAKVSPTNKKGTSHNRNKSRSLDIIDTPEYSAQVEAVRNRWRGDFPAFCREKLIIVDKMAVGDPRRKFEFNACQIALNDLIEKVGDFNEQKSRRLADTDDRAVISRFPIEIVVLKARKVGVSTFLEARAYWKGSLFPETKIMVMAHERPAATNIANIAARFDINWDGALDYPIVKMPLTRNNDNLLEWMEPHSSSMVVETAGSKGGGSSRSFTYHYLHFSEVAFFPKDSPQVATAMTAKAANYEMYLESTANGTGNIFYDEWANAMYFEDVAKLYAEGKSPPKWWNGKFRFFWPWFAQEENRKPLLDYEREEIQNTLDDDELELIEQHGLELEQLAWRRREISGPCSKQTAMLPTEYFKQEHPSTPEEAFVSKNSAIYDAKKLNAMAAAAKEIEPVFMGHFLHDPNEETGYKMVKGGQYLAPAHGESIIEGAQFVQWELPHPNEAYVMGVDTAEGLEHGDWSVISIFSRTNGTQMREVARVRAKTPAREFADIANYLGLLYNEAYIVAERNPPGNALCERLVELGYTNLYHHANIEVVTDHVNPEAFTAGFKTTQTTKPIICERAVLGIRDDEIVLRHPDAIREWKQFTRVDKKYGAPEGFNDDCVMADLLAFFGMSEAPPLSRDQTSRMANDETEGLTGEEIDNLYWRKQVAKLKERVSKQNEYRARMLMSRVRNRRMDVFS